MSTTAKTAELPDAAERERAVTTFDRNLVVTAGAGTGKTTLLVDRLVHLLLRDPHPLHITEIVALTFTNKAADEMKLRLRERLQAYAEAAQGLGPAVGIQEKTRGEVENLARRYRLSKEELVRLVSEALRNIERSAIGTIHSFAARMLRLYPLEAGVDPQFREDDGAQFERLFEEEWGLWLDGELSLESKNAAGWRRVLDKVTLDQVKALAKALAGETVELQPEQARSRAIPQVLSHWLADLDSRAAALGERHPEERTNEKLVRAARQIVRAYRKGARRLPQDLAEAGSLVAEKSVSTKLTGWSEEDIREAQDLVRAARGLCRIDEELTHLLWELLLPFARNFRETFLRQGFISFDGLLIRARNLVRDHLRVREALKREYKALLIDEFQDTDPVQYEVLLYLAERQGSSARDWREVKLEEGKIFVVGDPKQSIYAFRRADIEAYLGVVEGSIKGQNGAECRLTTNFRSNSGVIGVVNGIFSTLLRPQPGIQPPYIAIEPTPARLPAADAGLPMVAVRKLLAEDEETPAEKARRLEGESLARWLKGEVLGKTKLRRATGDVAYVQPQDVAILFRKLTDIQDYLEAFRRWDIRYVVEGERHFYAAREIVDAVNLFRAVENPHDRLALVGVLRSPLGGLTDREIYDLHRADLLDFRKAGEIAKIKGLSVVLDLYRALHALHDETRRLPVGEAVRRVFDLLPIKLLAACYFSGEQAVANLEKLRHQAILLGRERLATFKEAIRQLEKRVLDVKEEGESVLAEENLDAVRIMSIHKAKGLEFPIVVLAGCQGGTDARLSGEADALFDWSTGLIGLRIGQAWDLPGLYIAEKTRIRAEEEQKRVLYVAMTRAREHLVLSCTPAGRRMSGSFVSMLDESGTTDIEAAESSRTIAVGTGSVEIQVFRGALAPPGKRRGAKPGRKKNRAFEPFLDKWKKRRERYESLMQAPSILTPTLLKEREEPAGERMAFRAGFEREPALIVGDLVHRFLQTWSFSGQASDLASELREFMNRSCAEPSAADRSRLETEIEAILRNFLASAPYAEIAGARILGREVPFVMPWQDRIMKGVIDLIYERNGLLYLADYKTDRIARDRLAEGAARYRHQAEVYSRAVKQGLGREAAAFKVIFLRLGEAVELNLEQVKELSLV